MKIRKKVFAIIIMAVLSVIIFIAGKNVRKDNKSYEQTKYDFAMGTSVSISVYGQRDVNETADKVISRIKEIDSQLISWRENESEISCLNKALAENRHYEMSKELSTLVMKSYLLCKLSDGALDITLRPLLDCWDIENATNDTFTLPSEEKIAAICQDIGYENLLIEDNVISCIQGAQSVDLGATGKGGALDIIKELLKSQDIDGAIVSIGGSILCYGHKSDGSSWKVGVRNPDGNIDEMIGYIEIEEDLNMCVSTSGDYEKYVEYEGKRYHHIIDRSTGYPANSGLSSVTVVCEDGLYSDGLSTACFVLGYEKSLELLEQYNAEAVFIDRDGNITVTDGLKDKFIIN